MLALAGLVVLGIIILFNPAFQRWVALGQLENIDPGVELERLAISPFSTEIRELKLSAEDWRLELPKLEIEYSPWSLLAKHVKIHRLQVAGAVAELDLAPPEADEEALRERLPGLWERTDLGWRISLDALAVDAQLKLPELELSAQLTGGGLAPEATGVFKLAGLRLLRTAEAESVNELELSGTLRLSESRRGALTSLDWDLNAEVMGTLFDSSPRFGISGDWTADAGWADATRAEAAGTAYPAESFSLKVTDAGEAASGALLFGAEGDYDATGERIETRYKLKADSATLTPFGWAMDLPQFDAEGDGKLDWDLATMTGKSSMKTQVEASQLERLSDALEGVGDLRIEQAHELSFEGDRVLLEKFVLGIKDPAGEQVIVLKTSHPLTFSGAMLAAENLDEYGFKRPWLSLNTEIPLEWLEPVLGGLRLTGANLSGRFDFSGSPLKHLVIAADAPFEAMGTTLSSADSVILEEVTVSLLPRFEVWPDKAKVALDNCHISARGHDLLQGELGADIVFGAAQPLRASVNVAMEAFLAGLLSQDLGKMLPAAATAVQSRVIEMSDALGASSLKISVAASACGNEITAESLNTELVRSGGGTLLQAQLLHPLKISFGETGPKFDAINGAWLEATSYDLPINALAVFIDGYRVEGGALRGGFTLAAGADPGGFALAPTEPWSLQALSLGPEEGGLWMEAVDVTLRPDLDYSPGRVRLELSDFKAAQGGDTLAEGDLSADVALSGFKPESVDFSLAGRAALVPLFAQPALAPWLSAPWEQATTARIDLAGKTDLVGIDFSQLSVQWLSQENRTLLAFALDQTLAIKDLNINDRASALNAVAGAGAGSYSMDALPLRLPLTLIETAPLVVEAGTTSGTFAWKIRDGHASLIATQPLVVEDLTLASNENSLLESVSLGSKPSLDLSTQEVEAHFDAIELRAGGKGPLTGVAGIRLNLERGLALKTFNAALQGELSPWFGQGFMPENQVTGGRIDVTAEVTEAGRGTMALELNDLGFRNEDPAVSTARIGVTAVRENPDDSWPGNASVELVTTGGRSDLAAEFTWFNQAAGPLLTMDMSGDRLHVGDLQRLAGAFGTGQQSPPVSIEEPEVLKTDQVAFWQDLPADLDLTFNLNEAIYTDYLKFTGLAGKVVSNPQRIGLERFVANFHQAEINASGLLNWDAQEITKPYNLAANFDVSDFDLNAFFTELTPGEEARVEGLFRMTVNAEGKFPTLDVAHNHIRFVFDLESLEGLFRAIPTGSPLARGSSEVAARAGAILSWTPTGGLALGALSRLVTGMREIPYNRIALKIVRDTDLNIRIEEMVVRSSEILIQGQGGILYEEGVDLVRQRMDLTTEMDARGNMAGILSGLGLLREDRLENGYWRGFRFRIGGSLDDPKSNFGAIVTEAGADALSHNVTNPFLGIWSHFKFRGTEAD